MDRPERPDDDELLYMEEAAEMARIPLDTFKFKRYKGDGPKGGFRMGKRVVFRKGKVRDWIYEIEAAAQVSNDAA